MTTPTPQSTTPSPVGLLNAKDLLVQLWPSPESRPSLRWLRSMQARRAVPYVKIGTLVFFEITRVQAALRKFEVTSL